MNEPYKDSIIIVKDTLIVTQQRFIDLSDVFIKDLDYQLVKYKKDLVRMKKKRKNAYFIGGGTTLGAFLLTFFLFR